MRAPTPPVQPREELGLRRAALTGTPAAAGPASQPSRSRRGPPRPTTATSRLRTAHRLSAPAPVPAERCPCGRADGCGDGALLRGASPAAEPGGALLAGGNCCALEGRLFPQGRRYSGGEKKRVLLRGAVRLCKVETTTSMPPNAHARPRAVPSRGRSYPAAPHWLSRSSGLV